MPLRVDPSTIFVGAGSVIPGSVSGSALPPADITPPGPPPAVIPAAHVSVADAFERYLSGDVEGALAEIAALVPPAPGVIGAVGVPWLGSDNSGLPDWGILKLWDGPLDLSTVNDPNEIYPYYWRAPISRDSTGFDPATDPTFNVVDGANTYTGGGIGKAHAEFSTVAMDVGGGPLPADAFPSWRTLGVVPLSLGGDVAAIVSGIASPADRGVLALVRWDSGDLAAPAPATSIADVNERCVAALLLGVGIGGGGAGCDGDPGGIWTFGSPTPFDFPGSAAGQYDLNEIHTGVSRTTGPAPTANNAAGQVRLLTDPAATTFSPNTTVNGLAILGATTAARGGVGTNGNFFAFRLPYLKDYSNTPTGVKYTPRLPNDETTRYFNTLPPALTPTTTQAGAYDDFTADYWAVQIGRYRHRFVLAAGAAVGLRRDASYALVHFRREAFFEDFVVNGVAPTADKVYSINLVSWSGGAQIGDLIDLTAVAPTISSPYSVVSAEVREDANGTTVPAMPGPNNLFTFSGANTVFVSGVEYYKPLNPGTGISTAGVTMLDLSVTNLFNTAYRSHDTVPTAGPFFGDDRGKALNQNPLFLSLSSFSYEGTELPDTGTITIHALALPFLFPASLGLAKRQRIEFGFADLRPGGATNPAIADPAIVNMPVGAVADRISFNGDALTPVFTENAKVRVFARRPQSVDGTTGYPLPTLPGAGLTAVSTAGLKILYHSMADRTGVIFPTYGNPTNPNNVVFNAAKDREERFLDETYRYPLSWAPIVNPVILSQLIGPGLPFGVGPIPVPVRPVNGDPSYPGWYFQNLQFENLVTSGVPSIQQSLQVAGLPERNPPYTDGTAAPFPSRGICIFPKDNYSAGYEPVGPDYSAAINDRAYVRAFNAGTANVGASSVIFRIWGVELADLSYVGPGPGGPGLAILVKLPGVTTWMDAGRNDGAGPSKQDPALDGAGCMIPGPNTFNTIDPESQILYSQIEVNLGPVGALFLNGENFCPVLVTVLLRNNLTAKALDWKNFPVTTATNAMRGVVGIELVQP